MLLIAFRILRSISIGHKSICQNVSSEAENSSILVWNSLDVVVDVAAGVAASCLWGRRRSRMFRFQASVSVSVKTLNGAHRRAPTREFSAGHIEACSPAI